MDKQRPTMKDVAERAGVSVSTVSYVLNGSGPVGSARRERVLEAVRALDYTPNEFARRLKRRAQATIALVVPDLANQFFAMVAEGVERAAAERDALVVLCAPEVTDKPGLHHARLLRSQRVDGVIYLSNTGMPPSTIIELIRAGPIVLVDEPVAGFDLPAVVSDCRRGAREVAQHVFDSGRRRVAVIGGPPSLWTAQQRLAGYREAAAAAGLDPDALPVYVGDYRQASGERLAEQILAGKRGRRPEALLCANDLMAVGAMQFCKAAGIDVPADVSLVGFDDLPFASLLTPPLTTVRQPARDMGQRAANLLFERLGGEGGASGEAEGALPVEVMIRGSVAPA